MIDLKMNLTFQDLWQDLGSCYRTYSIQSISCLKEGLWLNLYTLARLSNFSQEELRSKIGAKLKKLDAIGSRTVSELDFSYQIGNASEFPTLFDQLHNGRIKFANREIILREGFERELVSTNVDYVHDINEPVYFQPTYLLLEAKDTPVLPTSVELAFREMNIQGALDVLTRKWLGFEHALTVNALIVFPIYVGKIGFALDSKGQLHFYYSSHRHIIPILENQLTIYDETSSPVEVWKPAPNDGIHLGPVKGLFGNEFDYRNRKMIRDGYEATASVSSKRLGVLSSNRVKLSTLIHPELDRKGVVSSRFRKSERVVRKNKAVFVVHGQDNESKLELARYLENELGIKVVILHEKPNQGLTLVEKLINNSKVGFSFVILTPDDLGRSKSEENLKPRARQNVVFETGLFYGLLGRKNVCCLYKKGVELPSDLNGITYLHFENRISETFNDIRKELRAAKFVVKS